MFGKDKDSNDDVKAPVSFNNSSSMIPKSGSKDSKVTSSSTTLIAKDTELFGDVKFSGTLEVEGSIVGNISANPSSEAAVRVLERGQVEGDIRVPKAMINGLVKGNLYAANIELSAQARIEGCVHYETIEMQKGAQVNGSLVFSDAAPAANKAKSVTGEMPKIKDSDK